jgi:hypothetical protein
MRFAALFLALACFASPSVHAAAKKTNMPTKRQPFTPAKRDPSAASSFRVASFSCRGESNQPSAVGLVHLGVDLKNNETGFFGLTLYARLEKGNVATKVLNGAYTTVPGGFVLQAQWTGAPADTVVIHLHPNDRTSIPGVPGKLSCAVDAQMQQL